MNEQLFNVFDKLLSENDSIEWNLTIIQAVKSSVKIPENGGLKVRGVLQWYINNGYLIRTTDIFKEEYTVLKKPIAK